MKKIKNRSNIALLIAIAVLAGIAFFCYRISVFGSEWAGFEGNAGLYTDGTLNSGIITDRAGVVLASTENGIHQYAESSEVRIATLQTIGDFSGNIGTGALQVFSGLLSGWDIVDGTDYQGATLPLTISSDLSVAAYSALGGRKGAVIFENYKTGEILCMVSSPSYDPTIGFDSADSQYEGAYINRCISSTYTPGSIFKIVTLAAALENVKDIEEQTFTCSGSVNINGTVVNCAGVHGTQTLEEAFANSCNCAFAEISLEVGSSAIEKQAKNYGVLSELSIDGIPTAAGSFTGSGQDAGTAWAGIGQAEDLVTPFAMMRLSAAVAGHGSIQTPTLLLGKNASAEKIMDVSTADTVASYMRNNIVSKYTSVDFSPYEVCAKTGTAETGNGTSHSWFTGFTMDDDCPLAFAAIIEEGGGGLSGAGNLIASLLPSAEKALNS